MCKKARDICKSTLHIEFEWDRLDGLGEGKTRKLEFIFLASGNFPRKVDRPTVILVGFECSVL